MAQPKIYDWDGLMSDLFELLIDQEDKGADIGMIIDRLAVPEHVARQTVSKLREQLGDDDSANVIVRSDGRGRRYVLTARPDGDWLTFNGRYIRGRVNSVVSVIRSAARGAETETDRKAYERILRSFTRVLEDMDDLPEE